MILEATFILSAPFGSPPGRDLDQSGSENRVFAPFRGSRIWDQKPRGGGASIWVVPLPYLSHASTMLLPYLHHTSTIHPPYPLPYPLPFPLPYLHHTSTIPVTILYPCLCHILYHTSTIPPAYPPTYLYRTSTVALPYLYHTSTILYHILYRTSTMPLPYLYHILYHSSTTPLPHYMLGATVVEGNMLQDRPL